MNTLQEAEFHLSIYHYFLWKATSEKAKEDLAAAKQRKKPPPAPPLASPKKLDVEGGDPADPAAADTVGVNGEVATEDAAAAAAEAAPPITSTTAKTPEKASEKFQAMVDALYQRFPAHLAMARDQMKHQMQNQMPPIITTLYFDYPALQAEVFAARNRIQMLEASTNHYKKELFESSKTSKRKDPPGADSSSSTTAVASGKRARMDAANAEVTKGMSISSRPDVPEDVKELVAVFRENANKQKRNEKKRIARLEEKIAKERELAEAAIMATAEAPTPGVVAVAPAPVVAPAAAEKKPSIANPWKPSATFEERITELEHFRTGNGHCRVPLRQPGLGRWVGEMRSNYKAVQEGKQDSVLTPERILLLESMGFEWSASKPTVPWEQRFEELLKYKEENNGSCSVPRAYKANPSLGEWVHMQRKLYRQKAKVILGERTEKLEAAGFLWTTGNAKPSFEERLEECRNFRRQHGHLKVPTPAKYNKDDTSLYENKEERSFFQWSQRQRDEYRKFNNGMKSSLDKVRIRKLDDLGFDWEGEGRASNKTPRARDGSTRGKQKNEEAFDEKIAQLREIRENFGDINNYDNLKKSGHDEKSPLYQWIKAQRKYWKACKTGEYSSLTTDRIVKLNSVAFDFEPRRHYAAYGSKKDKSSEFTARNAAMQVVDEETGALDNRSPDYETEEDVESRITAQPTGYV